MFKVQNTCGKNIALMLERCGMVIRAGQCIDLDVHCSREWINRSFDVRRLLEVGSLRLVHDSKQVIPQVPTKPITRYTNSSGEKKAVSNREVEVLDLSEHPDVEVDDFGRLHTEADALPEPEPEPERHPLSLRLEEISGVINNPLVEAVANKPVNFELPEETEDEVKLATVPETKKLKKKIKKSKKRRVHASL